MAAPYGNDNFHQGRIWRAAINQALEKRGRGDRMEALRAVAEKLIDAAEQGDIAALKELGDRVEGKAQQVIDANLSGALVVQISEQDARV